VDSSAFDVLEFYFVLILTPRMRQDCVKRHRVVCEAGFETPALGVWIQIKQTHVAITTAGARLNTFQIGGTCRVMFMQ
jgi:hypothetical protein